MRSPITTRRRFFNFSISPILAIPFAFCLIGFLATFLILAVHSPSFFSPSRKFELTAPSSINIDWNSNDSDSIKKNCTRFCKHILILVEDSIETMTYSRTA